MRCNNYSEIKQGNCPISDLCVDQCPTTTLNVCAHGDITQHKAITFHNPCLARCVNAFILHLGACDEPQCLPFDGIVAVADEEEPSSNADEFGFVSTVQRQFNTLTGNGLAGINRNGVNGLSSFGDLVNGASVQGELGIRSGGGFRRLDMSPRFDEFEVTKETQGHRRLQQLSYESCAEGNVLETVHAGGCDDMTGMVWFRSTHEGDSGAHRFAETSQYSSARECAKLAYTAGKNYINYSPQWGPGNTGNWGCVAFDACNQIGFNPHLIMFGLYALKSQQQFCAEGTGEVWYRSLNPFIGNNNGINRFAPTSTTKDIRGCYDLAARSGKKIINWSPAISGDPDFDWGCKMFDTCKRWETNTHWNNYLTCAKTLEEQKNEHCKKMEEPAKCDKNRDLRWRTIDGACNNDAHPEWGRKLQNLQPILSPLDEVPVRMKTAREVSIGFKKGMTATRNNPTPNKAGVEHTAWLHQYGQFLIHDISKTMEIVDIEDDCTCRDEDDYKCLNIPLNLDDPMVTRTGVSGRCIPFGRSSLCNDEPINGITGWLDGGVIYGSDVETGNALRAHKCGLMATSTFNGATHLPLDGNSEGSCARQPFQDGQCFLAGDARVSEVIGLTASHLIWVKLHNKLATMVRAAGVQLSDEDIFQKTREIVVAILSAVTYNDYLPELLGRDMYNKLIGDYPGYDPKVNPAVWNEFTTSAYRLHNNVHGEFALLNERWQKTGSVSLVDGFFHPEAFVEAGLGPMIRGLSVNPNDPTDLEMTDDLHGSLFKEEECSFGFDLGAMNVQRGRDHKLKPYSEYKKWAVEELAQFGVEFPADVDRRQQNIMTQTYGSSVEADWDLWAGCLAEPHLEGSTVGPTNAAMIAKAFRDVRTADKFWYENRQMNSQAKIDAANAIDYATILCEVGEINQMQPNPFTEATGNNQRRLCSQIVGTKLQDAVDAFVGQASGPAFDAIGSVACGQILQMGACPQFPNECAFTCRGSEGSAQCV